MTFTNKGYVEYTKNLIVSNINNKVNANIRVYALDQYSYDYFQDFHDDVIFYKKQDFENSYLSQSDKNFGNLMIVKFELIYKELLERDNVVYVEEIF